MDFSKRHNEVELMDDLELSSDMLRRTYEDISLANGMLGGDSGVVNALMKLIEENPKSEYSIIDVGCGNGAILRKVCNLARSQNLQISLLGVDFNEAAILLAKETSVTYPEITYQALDVLANTCEIAKADFVISTLTMHHIGEKDVLLFLNQLINMARIGVLVNDLQRSRIAYYLFKMFSVIFIKTKIAKNDGLISIRSGFAKKELLNYAQLISDGNHSIKWQWAFRYMWIIRLKQPLSNE